MRFFIMSVVMNVSNAKTGKNIGSMHAQNPSQKAIQNFNPHRSMQGPSSRWSVQLHIYIKGCHS